MKIKRISPQKKSTPKANKKAKPTPKKIQSPTPQTNPTPQENEVRLFKLGRPPMFKNPQELADKIDDYFKNGITQKEVIVGPPNNRISKLIPVPTITGLALHLGFCDRRSFYEYGEKPDFTHTINGARAYIEKHYEELAQTVGGAAIIFALKNMGWKDESKIEIADNNDIAKKIIASRHKFKK